MFGGSQNYGPTANESVETRPAKRPRNASGPTEHTYREATGAVAGPSSGAHIQDAQMPPPPPPMTISSSVGSEMHQTPRAGGNGAKVRADDKNNRKLSCKECRRLKLKCDRVFPCQSCVKRGCGSLCPEGALTSGRGSRFILANTETLHEKIAQLSERVRQLEDGLQTVQNQVSDRPHPLLAPELLKIKTSQELYGGPQSVAPVVSPSPSQEAGSSRDERLRESVSALSIGVRTETAPSSSRMDVDQPAPLEVPQDILQLSATFPFPWSLDLGIRKRIRAALPPREDALAICEEARKHALWQYNLDSSETFIPNLLHYCYTTSIENLSPRRLALLLMVLSIGSLVDLNRPLGSLHGEAYHHLARAAVCEIPLMEEPDFDVLHALFLMLWYHLIFSDNNKAIGYAWNLMGFVAKLAQGLGLHRESPRLKLIPEEHEKRKAVFWELLNMDCRMSLSLGRPPSISLAHVDVKPPTYVGPGIYAPREEIVYHEWKGDFFIKCLSPVLEVMVAIDPVPYSRVLELDKELRDHPVPSILDNTKPSSSPTRFLAMQRALVSMGREIAVLQLHRKYFTCAMSNSSSFGLQHKHAPSVVATYLAASALVSTVDALFNLEQQLSARFLHFWFNSFSAAVTLSLLISRAPSTPLAKHALQGLERAGQLFRRGASILPFCAKALPVIQKLIDKSQRTLAQAPGQLPEKPSTAPLTERQSHSQPFDRAHPILASWAETSSTMSYTYDPALEKTDAQASTAGSSRSSSHSTDPAPADTWLPDVYRFSSVGLGLDDRYQTPISQPATPFVPSLPRVAETKDFNFDYGDLTIGLVEETSYMAWF